jgi:hypothetical protein
MGKRRQKQRSEAPYVRYAEARSQIKTGDVLMFQGTQLISYLIRWGSRSRYSHAGLAVWWTDRLFVIHSILHGVQLQPVSVAVDAYDGQVDWYGVKPELQGRLDRDRLLAEAQQDLAIPYSKKGVVLLALRMLLGRYRGTPDPKAAPPALFCSEYVSRCYRVAGVDLYKAATDAFTTPGHIARSKSLEIRGILHTGKEDQPAEPAG